MFTTPEVIRCHSCPFVRQENDEWICDEFNTEIHEISDAECPMEDGDDY